MILAILCQCNPQIILDKISGNYSVRGSKFVGLHVYGFVARPIIIAIVFNV